MARFRIHSQRGSAFVSATVGAAVLIIVGATLLSYLRNEYNFNVSFTGLSQLTINPGATLQIYIAGSVTPPGNGLVN